MTQVDDYRAKANEFMARAQRETNPALRVQYETLGQSYLRLAHQAERNNRTDLVYETPRPAAHAASPQQQQQQQIQPRKAED